MGFRCSDTIPRLEQEKLWFRSNIHDEAVRISMFDRSFQCHARTAGEGRAIRIVDVTNQPSHGFASIV